MMCKIKHTQKKKNGLAFTHNMYNKENTPIQQIELLMSTYNNSCPSTIPKTQDFILVYNVEMKCI